MDFPRKHERNDSRNQKEKNMLQIFHDAKKDLHFISVQGLSVQAGWVALVTERRAKDRDRSWGDKLSTNQSTSQPADLQ